ncbi:MAG TPA: SDR family oxidoreductase [Candidatus Limnocylindrales bacterium]|nr:SDR family oxidoreductase [Candidatus Limnocylindrales bacterium]
MSTSALAMVTGASSGIGKSFAQALAARGTDLILVARNKSRLDELAAELRSRHGRDISVLIADLEKPEELAQVEKRLHDDARIDLLVNNAGYGVTGNFADLPVDHSQGQIECNVIALTRLSHAALTTMRTSRRGGIINIASGAAFVPTPQISVYCATKAYVVNFSLALNEETKPYGVRCMVVCPGFTRTEFQSRANYDTSSMPSFVWQTADDVVRESLAAYDKGEAMLVPGFQNKVSMMLTSVIPKTLLVSLAGRFGKQPVN